MKRRPWNGVTVQAVVQSGYANLGKVLSNPNVSTVPTPDLTSTRNLAQQIDSFIGFSNIVTQLGRIPPTVHKPAVNTVTAVTPNPLAKLGGHLGSLRSIFAKKAGS